MRKIARELGSLLRPTRLGALHWAAKRALLARGYRWELRRKGALKLGVFRKKFRKPKPGSTPRRLVVLPGFGDSPLSWLPVFGLAQAAVRKNFDEVLFVDFPGFSGFLAEARSFHSMDLLLESVFDLLDAEKPGLVLGHSLGGWLAALYAAECGKGARPVSPSGKKSDYTGPSRLFLVVPGGFFETAEQKVAWEQSIAAFLDAGENDGWRTRVFHREPVWFRLIAEDARKFLSREDIRQFLRSVREEHYLEKRFVDIRSAVTLLWAEHDALLPVSCAVSWLGRLPAEKQGFLLKRVGHSPHLENPAAMGAILHRLISGKTPGGWGARWWEALR